MPKEYLEREALIESFGTIPPWTGYCEEYTFEESLLIRTILKIIKEHILKQPTADVVEVVRCKDCEHHNNIECAEGFCWCEKTNSGVTDNHFCSYGERKDK